jgi:hypothetical protein
MSKIPNKIFSGKWGKCHCQGACLDTNHEYVYYSFTTKLVKTDLEGNVIGSVDNIIGHLGCMEFCDDDQKVYASLEYKNDEIGKGILRSLGISEENADDGFYVAIFDVEKIDRIGMDAEKDGIMRAVYLKKVVEDYKGSVNIGDKTFAHVHGCSGIDGMTIGPDFGPKDGKQFLYVCYGVYSDLERSDNDYQVIHKYDFANFWDIAKPLTQRVMHKVGPAKPDDMYFLYTGNTTYGIQNLEYDPYTGDFFVYVYRGKKAEYPNYDNFVIDGKIAPKLEELKGCNGEVGKVLTLKTIGKTVNGVSGINFAFGSMGAYSLCDGNFMFIEPIHADPNNLDVNFIKYKLITDGDEYRYERLEK